MKRLVHPLRVRPRLALALLLGVGALAASPATLSAASRILLGWNIAVWSYLLLVLQWALASSHAHQREAARAQAQSAGVVTALALLSVCASLAGVLLELGGRDQGPLALGLAISTLVGSWLLVPVLFAFSYASQHHSASSGDALRFPDADAPGFEARFGDFLYVAMTIAVAQQTADVAVATPRLRRWVLVQSLLSFAFNVAIIGLTVNLAAVRV